MVFGVALLIIVGMGVGGAELVRVQCRRMLSTPHAPSRARKHREPSRREPRSRQVVVTVRPPAHAAAVPASPQLS
jgi:hypothetical protein